MPKMKKWQTGNLTNLFREVVCLGLRVAKNLDVNLDSALTSWEPLITFLPPSEFHFPQGFPGGSVVKNLPANAGDVGLTPGSGRSPEKQMATHSSILNRKSAWTEEPGGLQSTGSQRVGHGWATEHKCTCSCFTGWVWGLNKTRPVMCSAQPAGAQPLTDQFCQKAEILPSSVSIADDFCDLGRLVYPAKLSVIRQQSY